MHIGAFVLALRSLLRLIFPVFSTCGHHVHLRELCLEGMRVRNFKTRMSDWHSLWMIPNSGLSNIRFGYAFTSTPHVFRFLHLQPSPAGTASPPTKAGSGVKYRRSTHAFAKRTRSVASLVGMESALELLKQSVLSVVTVCLRWNCYICLRFQLWRYA